MIGLRFIISIVITSLLYSDIVLALPNTLQPNSAFDGDPRNDKVRTEMIEYLSVKSSSNKVYKEARLAQKLFELGYVAGTGIGNKYIKPKRKLLIMWRNAKAKRLNSVFIEGYLVRLERMGTGKGWELSHISNQATGEEEYYVYGVYQRSEVRVVKDKGKVLPAVKKKEAEVEPQKPSLRQQILIAFSRLARPTLRELMEFIRDEWGTETDERAVLIRIAFLNFNRKKAGASRLVLVSEEEARKRREAKPEVPAKPVKPAEPPEPAKPVKPEPEEQKGFNRIILSYAEELKKGIPIEGIKEKLRPLIEGFSGWEADAEEGEIKTKFMGNNTLVIGVLENKRYKMIFKWHNDLGLLVVLKETGKDIGEDIIYDLSNCRDYDETGQHKRINALWKGAFRADKGRGEGGNGSTWQLEKDYRISSIYNNTCRK